MRWKIASAVMLTLCVLWLAVLTGAIPVLPGAEPVGSFSAGEPSLEDGEAVPASGGGVLPATEAPASPSPAADTAGPSPSPTPTTEAAAAPEQEAVTVPETADEEAASGIRVATTTITGDGPLDNDTSRDVDPEALLAEGLALSLPAEGYQVLILHTHATEAYTPGPEENYEESGDYRTTDPAYSVIRVGDELAEALSAWGLRVLHDTTLHDYPNYTGSYARSGETVEAYLAAYPSIRVVIDLHRDALGDEQVVYRTLADIDGLEAAQLMFVMGTDVNLDHPLWRENLKLALTLQDLVQSRYPTLMRPTVLCDYRYNQQLLPGCLLLEVGTCGNTLEEAITAVQLFGSIAGPYLASCLEE